MNIPIFRTAEGERRGVVALAFDVKVEGLEIDRVEHACSEWNKKGFDTVVLVGNRFEAFPLPRTGETTGIDGEVGMISAPAVYDWVQENLPDAKDVVLPV